jgi:ankyrin repeat protein
MLLFRAIKRAGYCCGFGVESNTQHGLTALLWATSAGHANCVQLLIDAGVDKNSLIDVRVDRR